ncbi:tyrosine-type recombinase/integrase [Hyphomonas sp. UBA1923]|uniref:tyrosine-type recombinase/integrase n=1 Tax=Hyphomonas sp. UBA1923 TaxID=1946617 RepID=UPI0025C47B99|nr:site-specific integrase [Hyphomonas sp. UBA1923]
MAWIKERTTKDGKTHYKVVIRLKGYPTQTATFERKVDARTWATQTEAALRENRYFKTVEEKRRTFGELVDQYLSKVAPFRHKKPTAARAIKCHLTWWKLKLGPYILADITPSRIAALRDELLTTPTTDSNGKELRDTDGNARRAKSPATVNRYLASLSVMYTHAVNEWGWVNDNPVRKVRRPSEPRGRVRFLSDDERQRLLTACRESPNKLLYPLVIVTLSTGARRGEMLNLRWPEVDLKRNVIRLHETKNDERRSIPIVSLAHKVLTQLRASAPNSTGYVFPRPDGTKPVHIDNDWAIALTKANIEDFRFHDLRHSAASYLAMNGATPSEIAEVLGHKTLQMVKRYAHLSEPHTISVVERMNKAVFEDESS